MGKQFYWKGGSSGAADVWNIANNWFNDEALTSPASDYPDDPTDIAIIPPGMTAEYNINYLGDNITIAALINLSDGGRYFAASDYTLTVGAAVLIGSGCYHSGNMTGTCVFSGPGSYNGCYITGDAVFSGSYSYNYGDVGSAIFSGTDSYNDYYVDNAIFSGASSKNNYYVNYSGIFSGGGSNNTGQVGVSTNNAVMAMTGSSSYNYGSCFCNAVVSGPSAQSGPVQRACILDGSSARITDQISKGAIILTGYNDVQTINGGCIIAGESVNTAWNEGTINGGCILGDYGKNHHASGIINDGCLIVGSNAENVVSTPGNPATGGTIAGPCIVLVGSTFTNSGTISGTLLPMTTFTNSGTLSGKKPLDVVNAGI